MQAASTSAEPQQLPATSTTEASHEFQQVTDLVHRIYPPKGVKVGVPRVEIVFIHGITRPGQKLSYITTWMTPDGSLLWPQVWLPKVFDGAAVYLVSYDSSVTTDSTNGRSDLYVAGESVLANLQLAKIGQTPRCPLILVGHDLGGLIIKQICSHAHFQCTPEVSREKATMFLKQLQGIFFLATPHGGLPLSTEPGVEVSKIYGRMKVYDEETSRLNSEFWVLTGKHSWKTYSVHHTHGPKVNQLNWSSEGSGRGGRDQFLPLDTDAENITKPSDENSGCFPSLRDFIENILNDFTVKLRRPLPFGSDSSYVPIVETVVQVQKLLLTKRIVVLCGEPGIGKSSLAKHIALQYQEERKHKSVFRDGCYFVECVRGDKVQTVQLKLLGQLLGVDKASSYKYPALFPLKLKECIEHLDVLIIVDNAGDYDLFEGLRVEGKNVKYLLTAEECGPWRRDKEMCIFRMDDIGFDYGRQILAKAVGFPNGIPDDLKEIVQGILEITGCNPLALHTLSWAVREHRRTRRDDWLDIMQDVQFFLRDSDQGAGMNSSGKKCGVYTSMAYAVKVLNKTDREKLELLAVISLFRGPFIHLKVIELLAQCIRPGWRVNRQLTSLDSRSIIRIRECRDDSGELVSVHPLRQHYLLSTSEQPVASIREKIKHCIECRVSYDCPDQLSQLSGSCLAHVLCALYGVEETQTFAKETLHWPCVLHPWASDALRECLLPFLDLYKDSSPPLQWFTELILQGTLHAYSVLQLFEVPRYASFISRVLVDLFLAMRPEDGKSLYLATFEYAYYSLLNLSAVHKRPEEALTMLRAFIGGITFSREFLWKVSAHTLPVAVDFEDTFSQLDEKAWDAVISHSKDIGFFAENLLVTSTSSGPLIKGIPGTAETLVRKFSKGERKDVQFQSLALFAFIAMVSKRPHYFVENIPGALDALFSVLLESEPRQASSSSRRDDSNLVILLEFLAMLAVKQAFDYGMGASLCLEKFWLSENSLVLDTLVRRALDWERNSLVMSTAFEILAHLILAHYHMWGNRLTEASLKCLEPLLGYAFQWEHSSLLRDRPSRPFFSDGNFRPGEFTQLSAPSLTFGRRQQLLGFMIRSATGRLKMFRHPKMNSGQGCGGLIWKYLQAMVARDLILGIFPENAPFRSSEQYDYFPVDEEFEEEGRQPMCVLQAVLSGKLDEEVSRIEETLHRWDVWYRNAETWGLEGVSRKTGEKLDCLPEGIVLTLVRSVAGGAETDALPWIGREEEFEDFAWCQRSIILGRPPPTC